MDADNEIDRSDTPAQGRSNSFIALTRNSNSFFGKMLETVRAHVRVRIRIRRAVRVLARPLNLIAVMLALMLVAAVLLVLVLGFR